METQEKSPVLFIVADAFRWDYLDFSWSSYRCAPFLSDLSDESLYVRRLIPNFGFCERTEMFTGSRPDESNLFTAMTFDEQNSQFKNGFDISIFRLFDMKNFLRRYTRRFFRDYFKKIKKTSQPVYEIPINLLPKIALTEDISDLQQPGWLGIETIFDKLRAAGKTFFFDTFASLTMSIGLDEDRESAIKNAFSNYRDIYLLYIGQMDSIGHDFGPNSSEAKNKIFLTDARLMRIAEEFEKNYPEGIIFIIGDHGMVNVAKYIDVESRINKLKKYGVAAFKDFFYFLDSTMLRIWFKNETAKEKITGYLQKDVEMNEFGSFIYQDTCSDLHIPKPGGKYGDLYWVAKPGCIIFPCFFRRRKPALGMHGYLTDDLQQHGFAIIRGKSVKRGITESAELIDVSPTLCDLLQIPYPSKNSGRSLLLK